MDDCRAVTISEVRLGSPSSPIRRTFPQSLSSIHPQGAAGFTDTNLTDLSRRFTNAEVPEAVTEYLIIQTPDGEPVARVMIMQDRGVAFAFGASFGHQYIGRVERLKCSEALQRALDEYGDLIDDQGLSLLDSASRQILEFQLLAFMQQEGIGKRLRISSCTKTELR